MFFCLDTKEPKDQGCTALRLNIIHEPKLPGTCMLLASLQHTSDIVQFNGSLYDVFNAKIREAEYKKRMVSYGHDDMH